MLTMAAGAKTVIASDPLALACLEVWGGNEPVDVTLQVPGMEVCVYASPFENATAGGDVHFVSSCGSGRIARMMVADVSGHGQIVAETARNLRSLIRRYMNHIDQRRLLTSMNEEFTALAESGRFATAVVMTYFSPDGSMSICNAGHPPPLVYRSATKTWEYLDAQDAPEDAGISNIPLGILADAGYEQFEVMLQKDDLVFCYTDSLIESMLPSGEMLGAEGLLDVVQAIDATTPTTFQQSLLAELTARGATMNDDVTMMLCRCTAFVSGAPFFKKLWGELRLVGQVLTFRRNIPWPEFTLRNFGGSILPWLSKRK